MQIKLKTLPETILKLLTQILWYQLKNMHDAFLRCTLVLHKLFLANAAMIKWDELQIN